jgi:hypothetical protein
MNVMLGFVLHPFSCGGGLLLALYLVHKQTNMPL